MRIELAHLKLTKPLLAVFDTLLAEGKIDRLLVLVGTRLKWNNMLSDTAEVRATVLGLAGSQTLQPFVSRCRDSTKSTDLVILHIPAMAVWSRLLPTAELVQREKVGHLGPFGDLETSKQSHSNKLP